MEKSFLGTYTPKLDEKGRFFLPSKFRELLADGLVITRGQERSLAIYPEARFYERLRQVASAPSTVRDVRAYQRMLGSAASDETPDKQGRLTIPAPLRSYADLGTELVVVGVVDRVEVWNPKAWENYSTAQEAVFAELNADLFPIL